MIYTIICDSCGRVMEIEADTLKKAEVISETIKYCRGDIMGAEFSKKRFICKKEDLPKLFDEHMVQLQYEYGARGYSGTLKECSGLEITNKIFDNEDEGFEWLLDNVIKWEEAKAIRIKNDKEDYWFVGGECSS